MMNNRSKVMTQLSKNEISRVSGGQECHCWCGEEFQTITTSVEECGIVCMTGRGKAETVHCYVWDDNGKEHDLAKPFKRKGSKFPQYLPAVRHASITTAMGSLSLNPHT